MNYADFKKYDTLNGEGIRHSLFVSGCSHRCKGCFNAQAWNPMFGQEFTQDTKEMILQSFREAPVELTGLSILGGEPFENVEGLLDLVHDLTCEFADIDIWIWSGYTFEQLWEMAQEDEKVYDLLLLTDVLVDGKFEIDKKDLKLRFRGSSNQRIINVYDSMFTWEGYMNGQAVEWSKYY